MIRLNVSDFSCIKNADFTVGKYNVLIGPQASGKSVISKLLYFFIQTLDEMPDQIFQGSSMEDYQRHLQTKFSAWFPTTAWGDNKFTIQFVMGKIGFKISRNSRKGMISEKLRVTPSTALKRHFSEIQILLKKLQEDAENGKHSKFQFFELDRQFKHLVLEYLRQSTDDDYMEYQTFIPAGRSFFTNMGRAISAFEQGGMFDPITLGFGRLYIMMLNVYGQNPSFNSRGTSEIDFDSIIGGKMVWENQRAFIKAIDGRLIPFSALSSGQQEILPLVAALESISLRQSRRESPRPHLIYIEEPEAHLFPSAQADIIEGLVSIVGSQSQRRRLILTTHSPYVLTKLNNLAKAGLLKHDLPANMVGRLDRIVKKQNRIEPGTLHAYAIIDGEMKNLVGDDGLIDGEYLDEISNRIGSEFAKLIDLELDADAAEGMRSRDD